MSQTEFQFTEERKQRQASKRQQILEALQAGPCRSSQLKQITHRFSACVRDLRESGYYISVSNDDDALHMLVSYSPMVEVTDELKAGYYRTPHWRSLSFRRKIHDSVRCCHCRSGLYLETHHWKYELFDEQLTDLVTLCRECHERIHEYGQVKIHFPHYVTPEIAARIIEESAQ